MDTLILMVLIGGLIVFFVWVAVQLATATDGTTERSRSSSGNSGWRGDSSRDIRPQGEDYWLEWRESADEGSRGYVVVRNEDDQRLRWQTLPRREGIRAIGVAGEYYHMENLQDPSFAPGNEISLVPEPDNPHGTTTVAIKSEDESKHVGYVPTDESSPVFRKLQAGEPLRAFSMWEVRQDRKRAELRILIVEPDASIALPSESGE